MYTSCQFCVSPCCMCPKIEYLTKWKPYGVFTPDCVYIVLLCLMTNYLLTECVYIVLLCLMTNYKLTEVSMVINKWRGSVLLHRLTVYFLLCWIISFLFIQNKIDQHKHDKDIFTKFKCITVQRIELYKPPRMGNCRPAD